MMRSRLRLALAATAAIVAIALVVARIVAPPMIDRAQTRVASTGTPPISAAAKALHQQLTIADMHADSLLWGRPLLQRQEQRGQVDIPRLQDANVSVQVFAVATHVPSSRSQHGTSPNGLNLITLSALAQWWPPATWWDLTARAEHLADVLAKTAARSSDQLAVVRTRDDLDAVLRRRHGRRAIAAVLAIEGLHALEGHVQHVQRLFDAGYRMMGLVHQFDNDLGGSSSGVARAGLTPFGAEVLREMERRGIIVDLAHASPALIRDVTRIATTPVVVSHTGVQGTCNRPRNLSDDDVRAVAGTGGLVGIGFWPGAVCGSGAAAIARAIRYTADLVGIEHVALGSDFDGDRMPFDVRGLGAITDALIAAGFSQDEIRLVMGENLIHVLRARLPRRETAGGSTVH